MNLSMIGILVDVKLWYEVVESDIPWSNAGKGEYVYHTARKWEVYVELLTGLYTNDFLREVMSHEYFEERLKKLLDEADVEIEWVDLDKGEHDTQ